MYKNAKKLDWKENRGIQNIDTADSQENIILHQRKVLKIWENYITELYNRPIRPEIQEFELEEEVCPDKKCPYILHSEAEKAIKEMSDKKAAKNDDLGGDVFKLFREDGLRLTSKLINSIYK